MWLEVVEEFSEQKRCPGAHEGLPRMMNMPLDRVAAKELELSYHNGYT